MTRYIPAEVFPPGEFLKEELDARGWSQADLADILGRPPRLISEIVSGKRSISPETAHGLSRAFGTSPQYWINLESIYQLSKTKPAETDTITKKAQIYERFPVRELVSRGWIEPSDNVEVLESRVLSFFELRSLTDDLQFAFHARKSTAGDATPVQLAWLYRTRQIAKTLRTPKFTNKRLRDAISVLRRLMTSPAEVRNIPKILHDAGIRFVIVEPPKNSKIDAVCYWLNGSPVIAMSLRYERIDYFWFTLMHEIAHIANGHGRETGILELDLVGKNRNDEDLSDEEKQADQEAAENLVPQQQLRDFIARVRPLYYKKLIVGFANRIGVHPGIVVGQLQHKGEIDFSQNRKLLVSTKSYITDTAVTDGWGIVQPVN